MEETGRILAQRIKSLIIERFPGNFNYTPYLAKVMKVHEKTVLAKLRGASPFTFEEVYKISKALNISPNDIFRKEGKRETHSMEIYIHNFSAHREDQWVVDRSLEAYKLASSSPNSTYMIATNTVPDFIFAEYEWVAKFNYVKWLYFNRGREETLSLSEIVLTPADREVHRQYLKYVHNFKKSIFIFNIDVMRIVCEEVFFFYNIKLLNKEEADLILEDYRCVMEEFEGICNQSSDLLDKNQNHVLFSHVLLSNDITIIDSDELKIAISHAYFHNPMVTTNISTFNIFRDWFKRWMHSANIISFSDPVQRYEFFQRQREHLEKVKSKII